MALTKAKKVSVLDVLKQDLQQAQIFALVEYKGSTAADLNNLRRSSYEKGVRVRVVKNSLLRLALDQKSHEPVKAKISDPLLMASSEDPVALAKTLMVFFKDIETLKMRTGLMLADPISLSDIKELSMLSSREESLALLVSVLVAPIRDLASTLNQIPAGLARALQAVADQSSNQ